MDLENKIVQYVSVPQSVFDELFEKINIIMEHIEGSKPKLKDFYEDAELREILGRKSTAMWELKASGRLPFYKIGRKSFYKKSEVLKPIEESCSNS